jgi:hypothetical protein
MTKTTDIEWYDGLNNFRKLTLTKDPSTTNYHFHSEILDVDLIKINDLKNLLLYQLSAKTSHSVEVLFSGGIDSEIVLRTCVINNIPCIPITTKLMVKGYPVNTHDLYYSEKICRELNLKQKIIEVDVEKFFSNGNHHQYMMKYPFSYHHLSIHLWTIEQCTSFPIYGGDYMWPWYNVPLLSPTRYEDLVPSKFMKDNGISGIGNMLGHSLDINLLLITNHLKTFDPKIHDGKYLKKPIFKKDLYSTFGFNVELRMRNFGWESVPEEILKYIKDLISSVAVKRPIVVNNSISWNNLVAAALKGEPNFNNKF